eukprot:1159140-Prorocentrum_minimum.AAC.1
MRRFHTDTAQSVLLIPTTSCAAAAAVTADAAAAADKDDDVDVGVVVAAEPITRAAGAVVKCRARGE